MQLCHGLDMVRKSFSKNFHNDGWRSTQPSRKYLIWNEKAGHKARLLFSGAAAAEALDALMRLIRWP
jgi:hypothetical protein